MLLSVAISFCLASCLPLISSRSLTVSPSCNSEADQNAVGRCMRPFLDTWELLRQHEAASGDLVFPILYYTREELLALCDSYTQTLDACMTDEILTTCKSNPLVSFVQSQVGYVCGAQAVSVLAEFDCISIAVRAKSQCRDFIRGLPLPELQAGKCAQMPEFFKCLEPEIYQQCGTSGLSTMIQAIAGFGCDISFYKLDQNLQPRDAFLEAAGQKEEILLARNATQAFAALNNNSTRENPTTIATRPGTQPTSTTPRPDEAPGCNPQREAQVLKCFAPLSLRWDSISSRAPLIKTATFPLFLFETKDLLEMCDILQATLDDCLTTTLIRECVLHPTLQFVNSILGYGCGPEKTEFFLGYDCLNSVHNANNRCLEFINGLPIAGNSDAERCKGIPQYFDCMETALESRCNADSLKIFLKSIQYYGCSIKSPPQKKVGPASPVLDAEPKSKQPVNSIVDLAHKDIPQALPQAPVTILATTSTSSSAQSTTTATAVTQASSTSTQNHSTSLATTTAAAAVESSTSKAASNNVTHDVLSLLSTSEITSDVTSNFTSNATSATTNGTNAEENVDESLAVSKSNQCTPDLAGRAQSCMLPLMERWVGYRNQKKELNNLTFPIFQYEKEELLELCDEYANAFLKCGFSVFESCLDDEMVRFANSQLGFACSPPNIIRFMRSFNCISKVVRESGEECLESIHGISLPGLDENKCQGIPTFYTCIRRSVESNCPAGSLSVLNDTITQFGCKVSP